jgi:hypothetical protein
MSSDPEWVLRHVADALDKLLKARKEAVAWIVRRIDGPTEQLTHERLAGALRSAIDRTRQAGSKLARLHPDGESLPIQLWATFKGELCIVNAAHLGKTPGMSEAELATWTETTIRAVEKHAAEIEKEIEEHLANIGAPPACEQFPLRRRHQIALRILARHHPAALTLVEMSVDPEESISPKTASPALKELKDAGLVRQVGARDGWQITEKGLAVAKKIPPPR